ncbi:MAG TPA: universal stress protein [Streptosporangiaceae bacterium]
MPGIIVGVDGSDHSGHALRWAMQEAVLRHAPLTVMTVCPSQARPATATFWGLPTLPEGGFNAEHARRVVQEAVGKAASEIGETAPEVTVSVATGQPTEELVLASRDADMLVVGSRGTGGFTRLLLGSVSSQVVHHAACPVVVIPAAR